MNDQEFFLFFDRNATNIARLRIFFNVGVFTSLWRRVTQHRAEENRLDMESALHDQSTNANPRVSRSVRTLGRIIYFRAERRNRERVSG